MGRNIGKKEYSCKLSNYAKDVLNTIITKRVHMSLNYMTPTLVYKRGVTHVVG